MTNRLCSTTLWLDRMGTLFNINSKIKWVRPAARGKRMQTVLQNIKITRFRLASSITVFILLMGLIFTVFYQPAEVTAHQEVPLSSSKTFTSHSVPQDQTLSWGVKDIDAISVHQTNKGRGVKIAVLDTGIDLNHPALRVVGDVSFVPGTTNGDDDNGHGTMVAGIIGALDKGNGIIGVAPEASIYSVKVIAKNGIGDTDAIVKRDFVVHR